VATDEESPGCWRRRRRSQAGSLFLACVAGPRALSLNDERDRREQNLGADERDVHRHRDLPAATCMYAAVPQQMGPELSAEQR
jgi:hypothetical protein